MHYSFLGTKNHNLKTEKPSAEGGTFLCCYTEDHCTYVDNSTVGLEESIFGYADYFVSYCGKMPASPDLSGSFQLFTTHVRSYFSDKAGLFTFAFL
jgi:hypothetical protein